MSVLNPRRCSACKEVGHISRNCPYKILRSEFVFKTVVGVIKCFVDRRCVYRIIKGMLVESINLFYDQLLPLMREREERWRNTDRISLHPSTTALGKKNRQLSDGTMSFHFLQINKDYSKILNHEFININERVRDVITIDENKVLFTLESMSTLGLLRKK